MKFLCLAYGAEEDWKNLTEEEQKELLAQDAVIRDRGAFMSAVRPEVTVVKAWDRVPKVTHEPFTRGERPLAGFSIIEAESVEEVVALVANTPCARAKGAIEIRPLWEV